MKGIRGALGLILPILWQMMGAVFKDTLGKVWGLVRTVCAAVPDLAYSWLNRAHASSVPSDCDPWLYPTLYVVATVTVVGSLVIAAHLTVFAWHFLLWLIFRL